MTDLRQLLACNMKFYRKYQGLSQAKLAEKIDTATNYIAMIETGRKFPSSQMLEKIASALAIDPPELFSAKPEISIPRQIFLARKFCKDILNDIEKVITDRLNELEQQL